MSIYARLLKLITLSTLCSLIILLANINMGYCNKTPKTILVLNSYHYGMQWVNNVVSGIYNEFDTTGDDAIIHTEYLDSKNYSDDNYYNMLYNVYQYKYQQSPPDIIICSDDNALRFLIKYRNSLFTNIPIVFCGINNIDSYKNELENSNITGVVENFDINSTLMIAKKMQPTTKHVFVVNDFSITGQENVAVVKKAIKNFNINLDFIFSKNSSINELVAEINSLPSDSIVLLMSFNKDRLGEVFGYRRLSKKLSKETNIPIYGVWDFYVGNGIVGGKCTDGFSQGNTAAKMARKILDGTPISDIPIVKESPNRYMFDYAQIQRFAIDPREIPKDSLIINKPTSFFEQYEKWIYSAIILFIIQSFIILALIKSIINRKKIQDSLAASEEKFNKAFFNVADIVGIIKMDTYTYVDVNEAFTALLGYQRNEIINTTSKELNIWPTPSDHDILYKKLQMHGFIRNLEVKWKTKSDQLLVGLLSAETFEIANIKHAVYVWHDITELKKKENELRQKAEEIKSMVYTDMLTNLPNKVALNEWLEQELSSFFPTKKQGALMFIDFDDLKLINDTFGHSYGDSIITIGGKRIVESVDFNSFVARVGGDEFIVVIPDEVSPEVLTNLADKIIDKLGQKQELNSTLFHISASIGIAIYPDNGSTVEELLKNADNAMYAAKHAGKNCWRFYTEDMQKESYDRMLLTNSLHYAIERNELSLNYQPQIETATGKVVGFEALLRWNSTEHGYISPSRFIPLAEQSGLIHTIGHWVLAETCKFIKILNNYNHNNFHVAINVSPYQLSNDKFLNSVHEIIEAENISPNQLEIEITENALITSLEDATIKLKALRNIGVGLSLDDFGVGYSSLTHLRQLPINKLKIDKSFIDKIANDEETLQIISSITNMAHIMKMAVIAEGVETETQLNSLQVINCDFIQGYIFSRPLSEDDAIKYINKNNLK